MVTDGMKNQEILRAYPDLELDDIPEALRRDKELGANPALGISLDQLDSQIERRA